MSASGKIDNPLVEGQHGGADELVEAPAGAVGEHGHGGDDGEAEAAVRAPGADGVDVGGGDDLHDVVYGTCFHQNGKRTKPFIKSAKNKRSLRKTYVLP